MSGARASVGFYFDCACPWSYLALGRLHEATLRTSTTIDYRPVFVEDVRAAAGGSGTSSGDTPQARYRRKDLQAWARFCGIVIRERDAKRAEWANRGAVVASARRAARPYLESIYEAFFAGDASMLDTAVVKAAASEAELDPVEFAAALEDPASLEAVNANGRALLEKGGFGTPSFVIDGELFFGNDRMPLVEAALARAAGMRLILPGAHDAP